MSGSMLTFKSRVEGPKTASSSCFLLLLFTKTLRMKKRIGPKQISFPVALRPLSLAKAKLVINVPLPPLRPPAPFDLLFF